MKSKPYETLNTVWAYRVGKANACEDNLADLMEHYLSEEYPEELAALSAFDNACQTLIDEGFTRKENALMFAALEAGFNNNSKK